MAKEDVGDNVVEAQDDKEPDVEGHDLVVEDLVVEAQDDEEPDVEAHDLVVEDLVVEDLVVE